MALCHSTERCWRAQRPAAEPLRSAPQHTENPGAARAAPSRCCPACLLVHTVRTDTGHALRAPPEIAELSRGLPHRWEGSTLFSAYRDLEAFLANE